MKILLVEDDDLVAEALARALKGTGYVVERAADGTHAETMASTELFDLIILDLGLPGQDGLQFLKAIRRRKVATPALILTARDGYENRIAGLDSGASDYVTKPFHLGELEARIRAILRINHKNSTIIEVGSLSFDTVGRILRNADEVIELSPRELSVLQILLNNIGSLVSKQKIASLLSDWEEDITFNAIDIVIHRLRKKLEPFGVKLQTIRGLGFLVES